MTDNTITRTELVEMLVRLLNTAERNQGLLDAADSRRAEAGHLFWEGYQAAIHDQLLVLDVSPTELTMISSRVLKENDVDTSGCGIGGFQTSELPTFTGKD